MHSSINSVARPTMANREPLGILFLYPRVLRSRAGCSKIPVRPQPLGLGANVRAKCRFWPSAPKSKTVTKARAESIVKVYMYIYACMFHAI